MTGQWNLCPGPDGKTNHDCRINMTEVRQTHNNSLIGFIFSAFVVKVDGLSRQASDDRKESSQNRSWQIVAQNWIRMVNPSGNGNGGYTACAPPSWYAKAVCSPTFDAKHDHFTKTGSGQTQENLKRCVFSGGKTASTTVRAGTCRKKQTNTVLCSGARLGQLLL